MSMVQSKAFEDYYKNTLSDNQRAIVKKFSDLKTKGKMEKLKTILEYGYLKQGFVQIIGEMMFI